MIDNRETSGSCTNMNASSGSPSNPREDFLVGLDRQRGGEAGHVAPVVPGLASTVDLWVPRTVSRPPLSAFAGGRQDRLGQRVVGGRVTHLPQ